MTPQALRHFALVLGMTSLMISCASNPASKPESATRKMESALTARRPGEVTATTADPLQRLAYRYNTTNWSYGAAIDIDRDLAKADPEVAGIAGVIAARIDLAANLSAIGRLTEAQADLLEAERTIQGGGASSLG